MTEPTGRSSTDTANVSDAFLAARELLRTAEEEAAQRRAEVNRYVRQREQEAELLVAKARRLLAMAEERAAALQAAPAADPAPPAPTADEDRPDPGVDPRGAQRPEPTGLDGVLASAIAKALDRSFPPLR